jgi:hypothetical protein
MCRNNTSCNIAWNHRAAFFPLACNGISVTLFCFLSLYKYYFSSTVYSFAFKEQCCSVLRKIVMWKYARFADNSYECSTYGDQRFSALVATLSDGRTIEMHYQCDVKGYQPGGTNWRLGKGKPPLDKTKNMWNEYLALWKQWANENPALLEDLRAKANGRTLTDEFASTPISQARALAEILNA